MIKMFFGDFNAAITTVMLVGIIAFIVYSFAKRKEVAHWGRRTLVVLGWGLFICITAATRDGYHLSVQHVAQGNTPPGLFILTSFQSIAGMAFAAIIILAGLIALFVKKQRVREAMFFTVSAALLAKVAIIECSRIVLYLTA